MATIKIYIVTTYTGTVLSNVIKKASGVPYPHVSLSLKENLENMYSLGRKFSRTPIFAGFVEESRFKGLYKNKQNTKCRVYSLYIKKEEYLNLKSNINKCKQNKNNIKYDTFSLFTLFYEKNHSRDNKFVCSTFVAWILEISGIKLFNKEYWLITPLDFYNCELLNLEYEGLLSEYNGQKKKFHTDAKNMSK